MIIVVIKEKESFFAEIAQSFRPELVQSVLYEIANAARDRWVGLAQEHLMTSRQDYVEGIQQVEMADNAASVALLGGLANMLEQGHPPFNLQDTMLESGQQSRVIGFRVSGTRSRGTQSERAGDPYRRRGKTFAEALAIGKAVEKEMRRQFKQGHNRLPEGVAPKLRVEHEYDPYAGMRQEGDKRNSQLKTYRTMTAENRSKWLHPGFEPLNLVDAVQEYADKIAPGAFGNFFDGLLGAE